MGWLATHNEWSLASVESLVTIIMASTAFTASYLSVISLTGSRFNLILGGKIFKLFLWHAPRSLLARSRKAYLLSMFHTHYANYVGHCSVDL